MNGDQSAADIPLEEFIALPDTIPLIFRDGTLGAEAFRNAHNIRKGTVIDRNYSIDYVNQNRAAIIAEQITSDEFGMFPVILGLLDRQSLDAAGIMKVQQHPFLNLRGQGTLIGFIDTGIDFTKDAFCHGDGTSKIKYIWDQSIAGEAPDGFYFGAEYTEEEINRALAAEDPWETVPHRDTAGHGTFLASVAAGHENNEYIGAAPDAEIIAVKLKKAHPFYCEQLLVPKEQENAYSTSDFMLGVHYIVKKADELGRPLAICIALGSNWGGHNGHNPLEEYLAEISGKNGVAVVCAAGNESQEKHHSSGKLTSTGEVQNVELLVGDRSEDIYLSLWSGFSDRIAVSLTSPAGEIIPKVPVRPNASYTANLILEKSQITIGYYFPTRLSGNQFTRIKIIHPEPGIWTISVHGEIVLNGEYHLWLPLTGFVDPETTFFDPDSYYTTVLPSNAAGVITCGAYNSQNNSLYLKSSRGPSRRPAMKPDLVAPGVNIAGVFPGGNGLMSGTSVSAAITAGICALVLQWGIVNGNQMTLTTERIKTHLIQGCIRDNFINYPNERWGYGRINLHNTLNVMKPL